MSSSQLLCLFLHCVCALWVAVAATREVSDAGGDDGSAARVDETRRAEACPGRSRHTPSAGSAQIHPEASVDYVY